METTASLMIVPTESLPKREEMFPMQEQTMGPVCAGTERPAADIFAERRAGFIP